MLIEIPAHIEMIIKQQAEIQGITAEQLAQQTLEKQFRVERPFNFDIEEIDKAINSGFVQVPKLDTVEELADWLGGVK